MMGCEDCTMHYFAAGAVVSTVWLVTVLILWALRKREVNGVKDSSNSCEMAPVTDAEQEIVYHQIAFSNGNRKPKNKNPEEEVTYAQVKIPSKDDDGIIYTDVKHNKGRKMAGDAPVNSDSQTTYAEIKPMSHQPKPQDGSTDLYAAVIKNKPGNTKAN